jgi:integrase
VPRRQRAAFGNVRKLPSGRWQARYTMPGTEKSITAPTTFQTKGDAQTWLATIRTDLVRGAWLPPESDITLRQYATDWLARRELKDRTREDYGKLLDHHILPMLGGLPLGKLTPAVVAEWWAKLPADRPSARAHAYRVLRAMCTTAVDQNLMAANPCRVRGAGQVQRASKTEPATLAELETIITAMPARYRPMVLLAAWCSLRFGELTELRGMDIDTDKAVIKVRRAVVWVAGEPRVTTPKSAAGTRDVHIPPHVLGVVLEHLERQNVGRESLLFPSTNDPERHMRQASLVRVFYPARIKAGRPDLRFHDLRHTGATMAARTGATLPELMQRLGHSTVGASLRYQHAARGRDREIAEALSRLAEGTPTR